MERARQYIQEPKPPTPFHHTHKRHPPLDKGAHIWNRLYRGMGPGGQRLISVTLDRAVGVSGPVVGPSSRSALLPTWSSSLQGCWRASSWTLPTAAIPLSPHLNTQGGCVRFAVDVSDIRVSTRSDWDRGVRLALRSRCINTMIRAGGSMDGVRGRWGLKNRVWGGKTRREQARA